MTVLAPGSTRAGSNRSAARAAIQSMSAAIPDASQSPRTADGMGAARATPDWSKPASFAMSEIAALVSGSEEDCSGAAWNPRDIGDTSAMIAHSRHHEQQIGQAVQI